MRSFSPSTIAGTRSGRNAFRQAPRGRRLGIEPLESRRLLAALVVNNASDILHAAYDAGDVTLRDAVAYCNNNPGVNTIDFDAAVFGTPQTISLTLGQLRLNNGTTTTISGPGADLLTISGNNLSNVFFLAFGASLSISGMTIADGYAANGGGIYSSGTLTVTACTFTNNQATTGGGIYSDYSLTVTSCTFTDNSASVSTGGYLAGGGGIFNYMGAATVTSSTFSNNTSNQSGGAINNTLGRLTVGSCTFSDNHAYGVAGGGISSYALSGTLTIAASTFLRNTTPHLGGAISLGYANGDAAMSLTSCTLVDNAANDGGGIFGGRAMTVSSCTIFGNTGTAHGGGICGGANTTLINTIVAGNTSAVGSDIYGDVASAQHCLVQSTSGNNVTAAAGDNLVGVDPMLAALADNGGPTQTMALFSTSPALDAGSTDLLGSLTTDQRGFARTHNGRVDIGAYEHGQVTVVTAAGAAPNPAYGAATALSVLGADTNINAGNLTYTWITTTAPEGAAAPVFSANGTNAARNVTVTVSRSGQYAFLVQIADPYGYSATSSVSVTFLQATSLEFSAPATGVYGATTTLTATLTADGAALAGQTVAFSFNGAVVGSAVTDSSGLATLDGVALAGIHAGAHTGWVNASFAGDDVLEGSSAETDLVVQQASLTITADDQTMMQGASLPTLTVSYVGLVGGDTPASLTQQPTISTTATAASPPGAYAISVAGAASADYAIVMRSGTLTVTAGQRAAYLVSDPLAPAQTMLCVYGAQGNDVIMVHRGPVGGSVTVTINNVSMGSFLPTSRIVMHGLAGNDYLGVSNLVIMPAWLYGDEGNDTLWGSGGQSLLMGGAGNDTLLGGAGRSQLTGGTGKDVLIAGRSDTLLIGGVTTYDANDQALSAILDTWNSTANYATRVAQITTTGPSYRLNTATVLDDEAADALFGGIGEDCFFKGVRNTILCRRHGEVVFPVG